MYWGDYLAVIIVVGVASFLAGWTAYSFAEQRDKKINQQDVDSYIDLMWKHYKERYENDERRHKDRG